MQIANLHLIEKFNRVQAGAGKPMREWVEKVFAAEWKTPADIKKIFASASFVKGYVIFNVGGNKYRLLTEILYNMRKVRILRVGTHAEYDRWKL